MAVSATFVCAFLAPTPLLSRRKKPWNEKNWNPAFQPHSTLCMHPWCPEQCGSRPFLINTHPRVGTCLRIVKTS
eukprot:2848864-Amphidinium_carterae.1